MRHRLDFAFLASLDILQREQPSQLKDLNQSQMQTGLAFYYCTPAGFTETPAWVADWTDCIPEVVADVAARCTLSAVQHPPAPSRAALLVQYNLLPAANRRRQPTCSEDS